MGSVVLPLSNKVTTLSRYVNCTCMGGGGGEEQVLYMYVCTRLVQPEDDHFLTVYTHSCYMFHIFIYTRSVQYNNFWVLGLQI